jgi:hypothetical protein
MQKSATLIVLILALVAPPGFADEETPAVAEVFACTYLDGKNWSDVERAAKSYNAGLKKVGNGLEEIRSFAWFPYRGNVQFDFLWSTNNPNLNEMARTSMLFQASEEGQISGALFDAVVDCDSGIAFQEQILEAKEQLDLSDGYIIESYVCSIKPGKDMGDIRKAIKKWHAYVTKIGNDGPVVMRTLQIGNFPFDLSYFIVHKDLAAYASSSTNYLTSKGAEATQAALDAVQTCKGTLWRGQQMTP